MTITIGTYVLTWAVALLVLFNLGGVIFLFHFWRMFWHLTNAHNDLAEGVADEHEREGARAIGFNKGSE